jgi:hypothetical protein
LLALAWTGLFATGCLPAGDPPMGRQVTAGRDDLPAGLLPAMPDGIVRLLVLRLDRERMDSDLYRLSVDGAGPPTESLLAENLGWSNGCFDNGCFPTDRRGRVFVTHDYDPVTLYKVTRIDPVTGDRFELGSVASDHLQFSRSRDRLAVFSPAGTTVYESDDRATVLGGTMSTMFVGEDFYYVAADERLMRLPSGGGAPEFVRAGVSGVEAQETLAGPVLILRALSADRTAGIVSFLDPLTLQEIFPPVDLNVSFVLSPDGRWLFTAEHADDRHYTLVDAVTGEQERFDPPAGAGWASVEWRPGRTELWFAFHDEAFVTTLPDAWIKQPGMPPRVVPVYLHSPTSEQYGGSSFFTSDGTYFFSWRRSQVEGPGTMQVGLADDPTGPRFDVVPEGSNGSVYRQLADGRLVTAGYYVSQQRSELRVVDPASGGSRTLATEVAVVAVGQRRVLVTAHVVDGYGDLRVIGLDSGESTLLAAEYARMPFYEPQGPDADPVTPGRHVAFLFQGRFASPYDGIWVATVP